jgi:hypothetical protein
VGTLERNQRSKSKINFVQSQTKEVEKMKYTVRPRYIGNSFLISLEKKLSYYPKHDLTVMKFFDVLRLAINQKKMTKIKFIASMSLKHKVF